LINDSVYASEKTGNTPKSKTIEHNL